MFYILLLIFLVLAVDFIPMLYTWQSRIRIGRYNSTEQWNYKITEKSIKWLKKAPTITFTDNRRLVIIDILKGNYKRAAIQHWQEAALVLGLSEVVAKTNSITIRKNIEQYIANKIDKNGFWLDKPKEIDGVILAYAMINLKGIDHDKMKPSYDYIYNLILSLEGMDGTIAYKSYSTNYRYVDTIGFICPFLINYGIKFQVEEAVNLGINQITEFNKYAMLNDTFIPCHSYLVDSKIPVGLFGWGRGLGWYAIGLIDSWTALPDAHEYKYKLTESVIAFAKMAVQFQNENGSWNWIVSVKEFRADSSTTATLAWFFANAFQIESIREISLAAKSKALQYLMSVTRRDGAIDFSQGDTKAIGVHSQDFDILPFTQGFVLRTLNHK
ncbi:glycoside hydrolase family 88 protein [Flavobacterium flavipallidum]|uniref:Glycoside hydrolase family 88 protein n=1 Tax=Flavobacterium flavipallidum TaxID=3139140 RepID=A0ABU9HJ15_9FLAO